MVQRRLVMSTLVLLALGAAGAGLWLLLQEVRGTTHRVPAPGAAPSPATPADAEKRRTRQLRHKCGTVNVASERYGSHIDPLRGAPADTVLVSGTTFRGEDWRFFPSDRVEVWWNTRFPTSQAKPLRPGPIIRLATLDNMQRCRFRTEFTIPDVRPGMYRVVTFIFYQGGYGWFGDHRFHVTR